ncbi:MAG TPA: serine/threonine-protein kinase, partial [Vicinamibacteria bacterium]|nr:serine/threonine-protein kinase [Vicinamibacteria bacterium]
MPDDTRRAAAAPPRPPDAGHAKGDDGEMVLELSATDLAPDPGPSVFRPGDVVAFRFRVVTFLARGGMGELYEAEDLELHERVALKTILSTTGQDERSVTQFKREVHLARQVTHPNVCRIFDVYRHRPPAPAGATEEPPDIVFLAMELLHGETLADRLRTVGRLSPADALVLARQMASALTAAHRAGVVHRDFKSENVMLVEPAAPGEDVRAVVTDFGLAKRSAQDDRSSASLRFDDDGEISGTPAYMAPEQVEGGPATPATDQYALGVVLYEMVTGTRPFMGESAIKIAVKRLQEPPPSPRTHVPELESRWEATILRCLAREASGRFPSVADAMAALEGRTAADTARKPIALLLLAAVVVAAIGVAYLGPGRLFGRGPEGITSL